MTVKLSRAQRAAIPYLYLKKRLGMPEIAPRFGVSPGCIDYWLKRYGIQKRTIGEAHRIYYERYPHWASGRPRVQPDLRPSEALAYVLGVLKGDGCITKENQILLSQKRRAMAIRFENALRVIRLRPARWKAKQRYKQGYKMYWRVKAHSMVFADWYRKLTPREIGQLLKRDRRYAVGFVRGFYESEGCNYQKGRLWGLGIVNTDKALLIWLKLLLDSLGYSFSGPIYQRPLVAGRRPIYTLRSASASRNLEFLKDIKPCCKAGIYWRLVRSRERVVLKKKAERHQVAALYRQGHSSIEIATLTGKSKKSVLRALRKEGVPMRHPRPPLQQAEREQIVRLYQAGCTSSQIAKRMGRSRSSVLLVLHKERIRLRRSFRHCSGIERQRVVDLYRQGHSSVQIARLIGKTKRTVLNVLHKNQVPIRPYPVRRNSGALRRSRLTTN
jgi:IS30 family transposase